MLCAVELAEPTSSWRGQPPCWRLSNSLYGMTVKLPGLPTRLPMVPVKVGPDSRIILSDRHTPAQATPAEPKRRRIWEISGTFHCSIIGTCLTTAELRQILVKIALAGAHK